MMYWYEVYRELATQIALFYGIHADNSGRELFKRCIKDRDFLEVHNWIIQFGVFEVKSFDPIHIFASINDAALSIEKRIKRFNTFFRHLSSEKRSYTQINF